jgi:DNA-binding Xre family transcriptional regulator
MTPESIRSRIRLHMRARDMNIKDLSQVMNIDKKYLDHILKYPYDAKLSDLHAICDALGIEIIIATAQR